ncbi:hypothetical protein V6N12_006504 [Hibiscus sabdariffa]|uniref:Uncharacterized protein n=1 Tax=Hibiscus sabdariffa TaxID=183260 RepID=A0ABR2EZ03_9ROSI
MITHHLPRRRFFARLPSLLVIEATVNSVVPVAPKLVIWLPKTGFVVRISVACPGFRRVEGYRRFQMITVHGEQRSHVSIKKPDRIGSSSVLDLLQSVPLAFTFFDEFDDEKAAGFHFDIDDSFQRRP